jgi:phage terminase large subunit-like protein
VTRPLDILSMLRLSDGRRWIEAAHDFQLEDAREVLEGERPYHFLTRARGASKTTDLAGAAVSDLLAAVRRLRSYWLAADAGQAALAVDSIAGFVSRTPMLEGRVEVQSRRVLVPASGASLEILPADAPGAWGLTPDRVYVDELANWNDGPAARRLWEAASSAVAKRDDARLAVLTTASSPDHFAFKVLEQAMRSPLWRVSERRGPAPWMNGERLEEQRARLPEAVFAQLFMNEWAQADGAFVDPAVVDRAFSLDGPSIAAVDGRRYVAGLDLGSRHDRTAFAIGHVEGDLIHLDRLEVWQGTRANPVEFAEVEHFIVTAHERFHFSLRLDPWQGLDLAQRLRARGIRADEFTFSQGSKQRLAATLLSSLNTGRLRLYEAPGLRDELLALRLAQSRSGLWSFDHQAAGHDDRAVAVALVAVGLLERRPSTVSVESYMEDAPPMVIRRPGLTLVGNAYIDASPRNLVDATYAALERRTQPTTAGTGRRNHEGDTRR